MPSEGLPPDLPLEIQFLILDCVNDDTPKAKVQQLRRLAFICTAWAAHIQSLLFRHVTLETKGDCDRFLALLCGSKHLRQHVTSVASGTGGAISTLRIQELLPNMRSMHLRAHVFGPLMSATPWSTVTRLRLTFCVLSTAQHLWDLLGLFPLCERLEFAGWMYSENADITRLNLWQPG
ncbi:hypothetical protein FB451DRAFT_1312899 [Mycena latifolia]|nr:hypothetical protein FB451DRAFT_1312899 [Mycena latifolia]